MRSRRQTLRIAVLVTLVALTTPLAADFATGGHAEANETAPVVAGGPDPADPLLEPAGHLAFVVDAIGPGQLTVVDRETGRIVYRETERDLYHDVDPSPAGPWTVEFVASDVWGEARCPDHVESMCTRNTIERVNYATGEREILFARTLNYNGSSNTHDVDRIDDERFLVADIQFDRLFVANTATGEIEWTWDVAAAFDRSTGGLEDDWTHINDVEVLGEDLYLANLRNQDQVVFVHRERGLLANLTLGADDEHGILYEQHNPDYVPVRRGGPALLVADSENNRIVEYQRRNGTWERTWEWSDPTLLWPRDADRLPNDNTLVTDTHGTRLVEVAPNGSIVWERDVPRGAYEAELLATGDESAGGRSMASIQSNETAVETRADAGLVGDLQAAILGAFPPLVLHGFLFLLPAWVSPLAGAFLLLAVVIAALWLVGEALWVVRRRL